MFDALAGAAIPDVKVTRCDYLLRGDDNLAGPSTFVGAVGLTARDGLIGSAIHAYPPSFIFEKTGYQKAEVRVDGDQAYIASPSAGNRWYTQPARGIFPSPEDKTMYETYVPSRPLIRVPMWPTNPDKPLNPDQKPKYKPEPSPVMLTQ